MIKVLIVDDDKLVRKGLMYTVQWERFGMTVVGEAANGEKAKEFIEAHDIDLLITDLAMPVLSGIELMRYVGLHYPHIWMVVLTFHQDFEYIQEALRIGAIDYIAKVQLDQEEIEDIFNRILSRIKQNSSETTGIIDKSSHPTIFASSEEYALVFVELLPSQGSLFPIKHLAHGLNQPLEVETGMWLIPLEHNPEAGELESRLHELHLKRNWRVLILSGIKQKDIQMVFRLLVQYRTWDFFYEYESEKHLYSISIEHLSHERPILFEQDRYRLLERWSSLMWINHDEVFQQLLLETKKLRPPIQMLESMLLMAEANCQQLLVGKSPTIGHVPQFILESSELSLTGDSKGWSVGTYYWEDWMHRITEVRKSIHNRTNKPQYSLEVTRGIMKAVDHIKKNYGTDLKLEGTARLATISRSYFSQCFKDITGYSFNQYVKNVRMEQAKLLLLVSNQPIYWIAEQCGYENEKYFRHVFREAAGMLPTEYRKQHLSQ